MVLEHMFLHFQQKDIMLQQVVVELSEQLHRSQLQVHHVSEHLVIATAGNNQLLQVASINNTEAWEAAILHAEEARMEVQESNNGAKFQAALFAQEIIDLKEQEVGEVLSTAMHTLVHNSHLQ
jgi:hypothetical protein